MKTADRPLTGDPACDGQRDSGRPLASGRRCGVPPHSLDQHRSRHRCLVSHSGRRQCGQSPASRDASLENTATPFSTQAIGESAARHGRELLALGFSVSQVVHDYGDICQAITELAVDQKAPITTTEFHILNRCLDTAIADAVTEHARITALSRSAC